MANNKKSSPSPSVIRDRDDTYAGTPKKKKKKKATTPYRQMDPDAKAALLKKMEDAAGPPVDAIDLLRDENARQAKAQPSETPYRQLGPEEQGATLKRMEDAAGPAIDARALMREEALRQRLLKQQRDRRLRDALRRHYGMSERPTVSGL